MSRSHLFIPRNETFIYKTDYNVLSPSSFPNISVRDLYISRSVCLFCCREIFGPILGIYKLLTVTDTCMGEIGTEAEQFPEKKYIIGIFIAVHEMGTERRAQVCSIFDIIMSSYC